MTKTLTIIVPVFNEEESLNQFFLRSEKLRKLSLRNLNVEFIFIDDGSTDNSFNILSKIASKNHFVKVISFTRNFGHQCAISAGIDACHSDYIVLIDADLQDPPELISKMYQLAKKGFDVVYAVRKNRAGETIFKKASASLFYKFFDFMCSIKIPRDTGDFRLISRKVADEFKMLPEKHRFIRGLIPWLGHKSIPIYYDRDKRYSGVTKYPLKKMLSLDRKSVV